MTQSATKNSEDLALELEREKQRRRELEDILRRDRDLGGAFTMADLHLREIYQRILLCTVHGKFNRGILFKVFWEENRIQGVMGIGPASAADAGDAFMRLRGTPLRELLKQPLEEFLRSNAWINQLVRSVSIPHAEEHGIIRSVRDGQTYRFLKRDDLNRKLIERLRSADSLEVEEYAVSPLLIMGQARYVLFVDNIFDRRPITRADKDYLETLSNTSAMAIYLTELKNIDPLTKCHTNVAFKLMLDQHVADGEEIAVIVGDLDTMKEINDEFGHSFGDDVLRSIAEAIRRSAGERSVVARLGGDEFAILLHSRYEHAVAETAERIRSAVEQLRFGAPGDHTGKTVGTTISLGVAPRSVHMLREADKAMYRAKERGKNRVCSAVEAKA
jgi:diguanylate cyclase (GGDEF)-like protein